MSNITSETSHRSELEGILCCAHHIKYLGLTPETITHVCDNEQAVKDSTVPPETPSAMIRAEGDIILAIHHLRSQLPCELDTRHVFAHQDTRKRRQQKPKPVRPKLIIDCVEEQLARQEHTPAQVTDLGSAASNDSEPWFAATDDDSEVSSLGPSGPSKHLPVGNPYLCESN